MVMESLRDSTPLTRRGSWVDSSLCKALTSKESDAMFFPGSGGKPTKANAFCKKCPVRELCLLEAIEYNYDGFFAGTTKDERTYAARNLGILVNKVDSELPPEPERRRRVFRKVVSDTTDTLKYLDSIVNPLDLAPVGT